MKFEDWDIAGFDREKAVALLESGVNPLISVLLSSRGITDPRDVKMFLDAEATPFYDPYLMADMDKAVARIRRAVKNRERFAIYGDYDVDGMTSSALLALWLDSQGVDYEIYIPGRFDEGYGLNTQALDTLKSRKADLVVTVDCGITAITEAEYAKDIGLGLIITDHHECREILPTAADAVVDPKRDDCKYPYKSLAGVGVVFKLICALENDYLSDDIFRKYGELTAIGTVADVMPVDGENRKLILRGLDLLSTNPNPGLKRLINDACEDTTKVTATTISYALAPRLNAAGRMGDPLLSIELLLSKDSAVAEQLVTKLSQLNIERRKLESDIYEKALTMLSRDGLDSPIVLAGEDWHQGVTGIVAAKMAERFRLPTIIISLEQDGIGRGSCRSFGSFSIYDALCSCEDILINFGGHEMAAGVTIESANIDKLRRRITDNYHKHILNIPKTGLYVDFEVEKPELLTMHNIEALESIQPYGRGNPQPCLCILEATLTELKAVGAGKHTKLKIRKLSKSFDCIFFSVTPEEINLTVGDVVDVVFEPKINEFQNRKNVQLQLLDIRLGMSI